MRPKFKHLNFFMIALIVFIFVTNYKPTTPISKRHFDSSIIKKFSHDLNVNCDPSNLKTSNACSNFLTKFDDDYNLNKENSKDDCNQCMLDKQNRPIIVYHHTFWKIDSDSNSKEYQLRVLKLNLMSYLATQNLCCTRFLFWKLKNFPKSIETDLLKTFSLYFDKKIIKLMQFESISLCRYTVMFKDHDLCKSNQQIDFTKKYSVSLSDFVRFFVLDQYEGVYTDGDVIYLKDMKLLWYVGNFAYRWSFTNTINTAVLGINRKINSSIDNMYKKIISPTNLNSLIDAFHPNIISNIILTYNNNSIYNYKPLRVLHSYLFDSAWLCYDGVEGPLNNKSVCSFKDFTSKMFVNENEFNFRSFFSGAFTYHLHLRNAESEISSKSYFFYLENYFKSFLNLK